MNDEPNWERYADTVDRLKVDGGFLFRVIMSGNMQMVFVPDIDLTRYQAHLRDAYTQGYADGREDAKNGILNPEEGLNAYPDKGSQ